MRTKPDTRKRSILKAAGLIAASFCAFTPWLYGALLQSPQPAALVIAGGTLIDGNGGPPLRDVQIVIQGNRIARVGKTGEDRPANAQVVNADGKFILPGLWDALDNFV